MKACATCGVEKVDADFYDRKYKGRVVKSGICKQCRLDYNRKYLATNKQPILTNIRNWQRSNPEARAKATRKHRIKVYGVTEQDYQRMHKSQAGLCLGCKRPETATDKLGRLRPLAIDHDHVTGRVRGLLCSRCNTAIGLLREDTDTLLRLYEYVGYWEERQWYERCPSLELSASVGA